MADGTYQQLSGNASYEPGPSNVVAVYLAPTMHSVKISSSNATEFREKVARSYREKGIFGRTVARYVDWVSDLLDVGPESEKAATQTETREETIQIPSAPLIIRTEARN